VGRPIAAVTAFQLTERFPFDSLSGPPFGALNSHAPPGFVAAHASMTGTSTAQRHRPGPPALEGVHEQRATIVAREHGTLHPKAGPGDRDPVRDLQPGDLTPSKPR
jgi:hypothetical protein